MTIPPSTPPISIWPALRGGSLRPLTGGLINVSFQVGDPPLGVLQRLHPVFAPEVNLDIAAVTRHLGARGLVTPRLLETERGGLWHIDAEGACWRALSWVPGLSYSTLRGPAQAAAAGALVARWHRAVADLEHHFVAGRSGVHDTPAHMRALVEALDAYPDHRLRDPVGALADELLGDWARWRGRMDLPPRITHGDLKVSNLRFAPSGEGRCLLDLDTVGRLPLDAELGDAWRSWCNPAAEDAERPRFDIARFEASARAYLAENPLPAEEREALGAGIERICLELAARFAADALAESYFGWDPARAPARGEHNLLRARGQLALARSAASQRRAIEAILT